MNAQKNIEVIESYLSDKYAFRYNVVTHRVEYKEKAGTEFQSMTDIQENSIYRDLRKANISCHLSSLRSIL